MRIAIDAMGGDNAPAVVIEGAVQALQRASVPLHAVLFGREEAIQAELAAHDDLDEQQVTVVHAPEEIGMSEAPSSSVKNKTRSSIHLGLQAHKKGEVDAFVSAGNTGAIMGASLFILGRIPGVKRPTVIGFFPTRKGSCIVSDLGTNVDCKPTHLVQFAQMGAIYARYVYDRADPSVGLLNIGEEPGKGNEQSKATYELLQQADTINFGGNIEGSDIFHHAADVVICDGFVGNILLKFGESLIDVLTTATRNEIKRQELPAEQQQVVKGVLGQVIEGFDAEERGGAPLLGVDGHVLIGHGESSVRAIRQMILSAVDVAQEGIVRPIKAAFAE